MDFLIYYSITINSKRQKKMHKTTVYYKDACLPHRMGKTKTALFKSQRGKECRRNNFSESKDAFFRNSIH